MSTTMQPTVELCNAALALTPEQDGAAQLGALPERSEMTQVPAERAALAGPIENRCDMHGLTVDVPFVRGVHANGYRFGSRTFRKERPFVEKPARFVAGQSLTLAGFELLDAKECFVAWYECIVDACDALKAIRGPAKVVRCRDRALMKHRPPRGKAW
jgi:hypothetical protein